MRKKAQKLPIYLKKKMHAPDPQAILGQLPQSNPHSGDVVKAFQVVH